MRADSTYAMRLMIGANRAHKKTCDALASQFCIHHSQHVCLMKIGKAKDGISQTELSRKLEISPAAVAVTVKKLEAGGYVKRSIGKDDNRYNNVKITDKGSKIVEKTRELFGSIDKKTFDCLTDEELEGFISCLEKINERNGLK